MEFLGKNRDKTESSVAGLSLYRALGASEKKLFLQALSVMEPSGALMPFDPDSPKELDRYGLIKVRQLAALCLTCLGRT